MSFRVRIPQAAQSHYNKLQSALVELASDGKTPPCHRYADSYFSDDAEIRASAAPMCTSCPIFDLCDRYASAAGEAWGVWAGKDRTRYPDLRLD